MSDDPAVSIPPILSVRILILPCRDFGAAGLPHPHVISAGGPAGAGGSTGTRGHRQVPPVLAARTVPRAARSRRRHAACHC